VSRYTGHVLGYRLRACRVGAVALVLAASLAAIAVAGPSDSRQDASYSLSETRVARSTGEHFLFDYRNPDDAAGKPPAVQRVVTILPRGARYNPAVPGSCTASDAELMAQGAAACPPDSAIGGGVVTVDTGVEGPGRIVTADVEFFNNATDPDGEFIFVNTVRDSQARTVIRADVTKRETITDAGMLPGTPPDGGSIDTVDIHVDNVSSDGRDYITTPPVCRGRKGDRHWTARVAFTYADGVTQTVPTHTPCSGRKKR